MSRDNCVGLRAEGRAGGGGRRQEPLGVVSRAGPDRVSDEGQQDEQDGGDDPEVDSGLRRGEQLVHDLTELRGAGGVAGDGANRAAVGAGGRHRREGGAYEEQQAIGYHDDPAGVNDLTPRRDDSRAAEQHESQFNDGRAVEKQVGVLNDPDDAEGQIRGRGELVIDPGRVESGEGEPEAARHEHQKQENESDTLTH